jgi:outer membrane immunogenic protein
MIQRLLTAALLSAVATGAMAADAPYARRSNDSYGSYSAGPSNWTGGYAGIHFGFGFGNNFPPYGQLSGASGVIGGVQGGYDYQIQNFVVGGAADISFSSVSKTDLGAAVQGSQNWMGSLRVRGGFLPIENVLLYGTVGLALGGASINLNGVGDTRTLTGVTYGLGGEVTFTRQWTGLMEYRYTDFGTQTYTVGAPSQQVSGGQSGHTLRVGVNYRF